MLSTTEPRSQTYEMEILATATPLVREPSTQKDLEHYAPAAAEDPLPQDVADNDEQAQYAEGGFGWTIVLCKWNFQPLSAEVCVELMT
jgi:hypothetical protein